ncbi:MAG: sulfite exporter TauE/SafE family protein [Bacteriovoracaceae bacterium]
MIDIPLLFSAGLVIGFLGTIVGVGGGFIVVPLLTMGYHFSPQYAVGTSMVIVALNALSGTSSYIRQGRIDYQTGILFAVPTIPGSFFGAYLLQFISRRQFDFGFGLLLIFIAAYLCVQISTSNEHIEGAVLPRPAYNKPLGIGISFFVGFLASMAGIGGGVIHVPAMIYLFGFSPFIAIPTSHFILAFSATLAAMSHAFIGEVQWGYIPFLGVGVVLGAQIGGNISHKIHSNWIIRILSVIIGMVAVRFLLKSF